MYRAWFLTRGSLHLRPCILLGLLRKYVMYPDQIDHANQQRMAYRSAAMTYLPWLRRRGCDTSSLP